MENQVEVVEAEVVKLTKIKPADLPSLMVGQRIVQGNDYNIYWATVKSLTSKQVVVSLQDTWRGRSPEMTFRTKAFYKGGQLYLEPYGKESHGYLSFATTPEEIALVEAAYAKREKEAAEEKAAKDAKEKERREYIAKNAADAHAANPDVIFTEIGVQGSVRHYSANILNARNEMIFVVASVLRTQDYAWDSPRDADGNRQYTWIWKAAVNYAEPGDPKYGPRSMGSRSDVDGKTLEELFQTIIERIW